MRRENLRYGGTKLVCTLANPLELNLK